MKSLWSFSVGLRHDITVLHFLTNLFDVSKTLVLKTF